jgi:hypothetical protein
MATKESINIKRMLGLAVTAVLFLGNFAALAPTASAAKCPAGNSDGKTIGTIKVGSLAVPVKSVTYPLSGELNPPISPLNAGVSARHNPLEATEGSSIIVWHINYKGCVGKLNPITESKVGAKFSVVDEKGATRSYKIASKTTVPLGDYKTDWFRLDGPRQLVFVTCGGKVVKGHYTRNQILIAVPT